MPPSSGNPALEKVKSDIESKLPPALKNGYTSIVTAGLNLLFSDSTHNYVRQVLQKIQQDGNKPEQIATAMVNAMGMIMKTSQGKMQIEAAFPALVTLTADVMEYAEKTMGMPVTPQLIKAVGALLHQKFMQAFGGMGNAQPPASPQPTGVLAQPQGA